MRLIRNSVKHHTELIDRLRFLKDIVSRLNIAIFIHDLKQLRHIWTNNNYPGIIGYTDSEVRTFGPDWARENYHPDDVHIIRERIEYFRQGRGDSYSGIYRIRHKLGHWVWVYSNAVVYRRDAEGHPDQVLGICIDFTENFRTMKQFTALFHENQRLRHMIAISCLTVREREVMRLIARGMSAREIAAALNISVHTVNNHRKNIMNKLKVRKVAGLVRLAAECGLG
ncbi:MAG: PAS domain-containing protein [Bacteroidales bacterium]|nr:PAS domain-containing protein [Bacteroidales bacterium]